MGKKPEERGKRDAGGQKEGSSKVVEINAGQATIYNTERILVKVEGWALLEKDPNGDFQMCLDTTHVPNRGKMPPIMLVGVAVAAQLRDGAWINADKMTKMARAVADQYVQSLELRLED